MKTDKNIYIGDFFYINNSFFEVIELQEGEKNIIIKLKKLNEGGLSPKYKILETTAQKLKVLRAKHLREVL